MASLRVRFAVLLLPLLIALSCGGGDDGGSTTTPTSPTPPPASGVAVIAGAWNGTSDFQQSGSRYVSNFTATVIQNDRNVEGTVTFTSPGWEGWRATFTGTLAGTTPDTQFVGTVNWQGRSNTGTGVCLGQVSMAGRSVASSMRWEAQQVTMSPDVPTQPASACFGTIFTPVWIFFR